VSVESATAPGSDHDLKEVPVQAPDRDLSNHRSTWGCLAPTAGEGVTRVVLKDPAGNVMSVTQQDRAVPDERDTGKPLRRLRLLGKV
jgi:hypothetical protein